MKIAQIAPLAEAVPPRLYGGTERIVSYLSEELVRQGHRVTVFATGDSRTRAELVACAPKALRLDPAVHDPVPHVLMMLDEVRRLAHEFDVLHFHMDLLHFPVFSALAARTVTTLHGRLDLPDLQPFYRIKRMWHSWVASHPKSLPTGRSKLPDAPAYACGSQPKWIMPTASISSARSGPCSKIPSWNSSARLETPTRATFSAMRALLFPIDWPEPFGLVVIESMACGTPVIAFARGSVPEVIEDGVTGFIVTDIDEAVQAVGRLDELDRRQIRCRFEQRFSVARMAGDYLQIYEQIARTSAPRLHIA
jgi:glycosyltransferase involved in cell wall biosynthesis